MKLIKRAYYITKHIFLNFGHKHKFTLQDIKNGDESWSIFISPANTLLFMTTSAIILLAAATALIIYTPIIDSLPGYRDIKSKKMIIDGIIRIDSLEREIALWNNYRDNIIRIMDGNPTIPIATKSSSDTTNISERVIVVSSAEDSLLRAYIESDSAAFANKFRDQERSSFSLYTPVQGVITKPYNLKEDIRSVEISTSSYAPILSIDTGNVIFISWSPEDGNIIGIQHGDGIISIYIGLSETLKRVGENTSGGEVIGYIGENEEQLGKQDENTETKASHLKLEIWKEGNSVNPETYINF